VKGEEVFSSLYGCLLIAFAMYGKFLRNFLDLEKTYLKFNKMFIIFEKIFIPSGLLVFLLGIFSLQQYSIIVFGVLYVLSLPFYLISIIYLGTRKITINRIILAGTLLAVVVGRSAAIQHYFSADQNFQLINFEYIIAAVVILFLFLNLGLLYKSKLIYIQNVQLEVQKQSELSQQRAMISADLHDDLGASLSSIHLNAIMAQKLLHKDLSQSDKSLRRIIDGLKSVIQNMGDIIWAINPDKQEHKSITGHLKDFYFDLMDDYNIQCNYHVDRNLESQITNINARKNLLLISKEAINNILKHAQATKIDVSLEEQDDQIMLKIQDNGVGMAFPDNNFKGNGLRNMKFRAEKIQGRLTIKSELGEGTTISCLIPLTNIRYISPAAI
jgi:signal transduction histidine kinase